MLVDWFTVAAQVVNFLILVWLMKRFLYQPILKAIATRDARIAAELADADAKRDEATRERQEYEQKNASFDQERAALSKAAKEGAAQEGQRLLAEAQQRAEDAEEKRERARRSEFKSLGEEMTRRAQEEVFAIARQALSDLATTSLEERLCEVFTQRLSELEGDAKEVLAEPLRLATAEEPALLRSVSKLQPEQQAKIQAALDELSSTEVPLRFETAPNLVSGIEVTIKGQKAGWSISEYLRSLAKSLGEVVAPDVPTDVVAPQKVIPDGV